MIQVNNKGVFEDIYSLDELAENTIALCNDYLSKNLDRWGLFRNGRVVGFCWNIHKSDLVELTHSAPVGYKTNWGMDPARPRSMPGWCGRVWIRYDYNHATKNSVGHWGSDPLKDTLTYTGTGGFGAYNGPWERIASCYCKSRTNRKLPAYPEPMVYSWDYQFFDSDFPNLVMEQALAKLAGKPLDWHYYLWEDPETLAADHEYMERCKHLQSVETA